MANAIISPQIPNIDPLKWDLVFNETGENVVFNPANIERMRSPGFITLRLTVASAFTFSKETTYCVTTSNNSGTYMCYGDSSKFAVGNVIYNGIIFNSFQSIDHPNGFFYFWAHGGSGGEYTFTSGFYVKIAPGHSGSVTSNGTLNVKAWKMDLAV